MEKTGFCDVICGSELFSGCFWTLSFSGESAMNMLVTLDSNFFMKICWKKLSPKNRKFSWYKYDQEGLKRGETWFL